MKGDKILDNFLGPCYACLIEPVETCSRYHECEIRIQSQKMLWPNNRLALITVYDHPTDYPSKFVARLFHVRSSLTERTKYVVIDDSIEKLRIKLPAGMVRLLPDSNDDPCILETWI